MTRALAALVVLLGCGPGIEPSASAGTSGTSGVPSDVLEDAAARITDASCRKSEQCACDETEPCSDRYQAFLSAFVEAMSERGGAFNADCLEQRIAAIEALTCDETERSAVDWETRACPIVEVPSTGMDCRTPQRGVWPCEYPQWCDQLHGCAVDWFEMCEAPGTQCQDAELVLRRGVGEPCAFLVSPGEGICAEGLVCDVYETCNVGVALGGACPAGGTHVRCAQGYCDCDGTPCPFNAPEGSGTCVPALEPGSDCLSDEQCRPGRCYGGDLSGIIGTCEAPLPIACDYAAFHSF